jgi:hypothetical protein
MASPWTLNDVQTGPDHAGVLRRIGRQAVGSNIHRMCRLGHNSTCNISNHMYGAIFDYSEAEYCPPGLLNVADVAEGAIHVDEELLGYCIVW